MKKLGLAILCIVVISTSAMANNEDVVKENIKKIAQELESKYSGRGKIKVAVLEFRTSDNRITPFNHYIQDELSVFYQSSNRFEVIDQNAMNSVLKAFNWSLEMSNDFKQYSDLSEQIFRAIGIVPEVFIYGQISDRGDNISLTGYLVPNGLKSTNHYSTKVFASSATTDKLLGKPIRKTQPKPQPQVVVVEKEVVVEKPVYVEKEVIVEKEVYVDRPTPQANKQPQGTFKGNVGNIEFEITQAKTFGDRIEVGLNVVNNVSDDRINYLEARFIDPDGNEFKAYYNHSTFRKRDLIEGITIKGTITFNEGNFQKIQNMAVLEITVFGENNKQLGVLRFRNVPVTR